MTEPVIAQKSPYGVELEPGTYWWCACGKSIDQPFCDGSHQSSGITPVKFEITEHGKYWLCGCKHSQDQPFCDGNHKQLD
jgi:CDGSH-type Zn-finger protein